MASSVDPVSSGVLIPLQMITSTAGQDAAGARTFAGLMEGIGKAAGGQSGLSTAANPTSVGSATNDLITQVSKLYDPTDPIKSQFMMMDMLGQRMEAMGRMHVTMSVTSGFTGIFKQLFNRHD